MRLSPIVTSCRLFFSPLKSISIPNQHIHAHLRPHPLRRSLLCSTQPLTTNFLDLLRTVPHATRTNTLMFSLILLPCTHLPRSLSWSLFRLYTVSSDKRSTHWPLAILVSSLVCDRLEMCSRAKRDSMGCHSPFIHWPFLFAFSTSISLPFHGINCCLVC